jgi:hypothetical protein
MPKIAKFGKKTKGILGVKRGACEIMSWTNNEKLQIIIL